VTTSAKWHNPLRDARDKRMPRIAGPSALVIFGVTGDLSRKKLMPAIYDLANRGLLPPGFGLVGFKRIERMAGMVDDGRRHAGQLGHGNPVALAGGAGLDVVHEHDVGARLDGAHVHIDRAVVLRREFGQLKVMRGKQREGLRLVVQVGSDAAGQRQAVKGRGAAADLVHQHE
jgi:hypothetical protein